MQASATLYIFSGRPNPVWKLTDLEVQSLLSGVSALKRSAVGLDPSLADIGGYQGLLVRLPARLGPRTIRLFNRKVVVGSRIYDDPDQKYEQLVLANSPALAILGMSAAEIVAFGNEQRIERVLGKSVGWPMRGAPAFPRKPRVWNSPVNNCYSYANNVRNTSKRFDGAQPGGAGTPTLTPAGIRKAAKHDGLMFVGRRLPKGQQLPQGSHYLAIVLLYAHKGTSPGSAKDFHCLRLDANGVWSHKNGSHSTPTWQDARANRMKFLDEVLLLWHPVLVGFFVSTKSKRRIIFSVAGL